MPKIHSDPFCRPYAAPDRKGEEEAIEEFLRKGGKVQRLRDSREADEILKRRKRQQIIAEKRAEKDETRGVLVGRPLFSDAEVLIVNEDE